jgi:carboxyl-terminal processing protease
MEPVDTEIPLVIIINDKALQHLRLLLALQDRAVIVAEVLEKVSPKPIELMYNTQKVTIFVIIRPQVDAFKP